MKLKSGIGYLGWRMKKDIKALIKRLTLLVQFTKAGKGWIGVDGDGYASWFSLRPTFHPSGQSESLDAWGWSLDTWGQKGVANHLSPLDNVPLSMVCPSLPSSKALFYTDGETVWLIDL